MEKDAQLKWFEDYKFIATIKSGSADDSESMIKAAVAGGIRIFEISMSTPQATRLIENYSKKDSCLFGATNIIDGEMAQRAINAGAAFLSNPYTDKEVVTVARNNDVLVIQGALTPTEAVNAFNLGVDLISIYPADQIGGPEYVKNLRSNLPFLKLVAEGGISQDNAFEYLKACVAVNVSRSLFDRSIIRSDNWNEITERAKFFTQKLEALKVAK